MYIYTNWWFDDTWTRTRRDEIYDATKGFLREGQYDAAVIKAAQKIAGFLKERPDVYE